jgi:hypothetical protein
VKVSLPRKRVILAFHRWLGVFSAVFLFSLALTGLALNHSQFLGLDKIMIGNGFVLGQYGMASGSDIHSYRIHESDTVSHLDGQLFLNGEALSGGGEPVGIHSGGGFSVIATSSELVFLTREGVFMERIGFSQLPFGRVEFIGVGDSGDPVLVTDSGQWLPNGDWIEFEPYQGAFTVIPMESASLDESIRQAILGDYQGNGISLYRVLLDLHSGRLFGWGGRTLMDLTAVAILLLLSSGVAGWLRKSAWGRH